MDFVDDYLFEGLHLLMAEDGSVEGPSGTPLLQLVDGQFWVNNHAHVLKCQSRDDLRYLYYALRTIPIRPYLTGSVQAKLSQRNMNRIPVPYPERPVREGIVAVLGALDDRIELSRKMCATLEAMAGALFKSWFVDFEPVRAKAKGRNLGLPPEIGALFPDSLEDSKLGEIPTRWCRGKLGSIATITSGKRPPARYMSRTEEHKIEVWGANGPMAYTTNHLTCEPILLTGRVGTLGSIFRVSSPIWPSDNTLVVRPSLPAFFEYIFFSLKQIDFASLNRGSTQPLVTQGDLNAQEIVIPHRSVVEQFSIVVSSLFARVSSAHGESESLAAVRDALLPKLISGDIRIPDAERIVEKSA